MLVKIVLKFLVGKIDAELLEAVVLKVFKAKDVKDTNGVTLSGTRIKTRLKIWLVYVN